MRAKTLSTFLLLLSTGVSRAALVLNGSFTGADGKPSAEGWTTNEGVEPNAYHGPNCIRGGTQNGVHALLSQAVAVRPGAAYRLTFDVFSNQGLGSDNGIDVRIGKPVLYTNTGNLPSAWTTYRVDFTATSETLLSFTLRDRNSMVSLTNVSLQAVPEPSSALALGLVGLGLLRRRR